MKRQSCHHIETSQLICRANQLTGFYLMITLTFNELINPLVTWCPLKGHRYLDKPTGESCRFDSRTSGLIVGIFVRSCYIETSQLICKAGCDTNTY